MNSPTAGLVPVHVGQPEPGSDWEHQLLLRRQHTDPRTRERPLRLPAGLAWQQHGVEPRWFGMDTSDCPVAVEPSIFHNSGAGELKRFLAGTRRRDETALVVAVIGDVTDNSPVNSLFSGDASVHLGTMYTSVAGRRLPSGTRLSIAADLDPADRDLAIRLLTRPAAAPWWALALHGATLERGDGRGSERHEAEGELHPILVDALGDPVVAAWTPPDGDQRWYIIPDATDWATILDWLVQRALPQYVPAALRRVRSPHFEDPDLQTASEVQARQGLADLEARYTEDKLGLEEDLRQAKAAAEPIRYGLLYGSGRELVTAVAAVLSAAGLEVVDLDELFGTKSADLLVRASGSRRLIEVKAASGAAQESLVGYLDRHLDTWPQLRPDEPVDGGILVVNHQHKLHPSERTPQIYNRPEFVGALTVPVLSTVELFGLWRRCDWSAIRAAVLGTEPNLTAVPTVTAVPDPAPPAVRDRRRWPWQRDPARRG